MTKSFKLGFIGGGINSAVGTTHFIASQMDERFKVEAGCFSRNTETNHQTSERWGIAPERRYATFAELLKQEKDQLDAIVVLTPTPDHVIPVTQAIKEGYAVICEKSLVCSSADAVLIQQLQNETNGFLAVTYNYTGYPMLRELKQLVDQNQLGTVKQIHIEMPQEGYARLNQDGNPLAPQQWRLHDAELPTLSLDLGGHVHNIIDFITGEKPLELVAMQSSLGRFRQVVDNTMCIARYTNNIECNIWFSKSALGYRNGLRVRVFGDEGSAEWHQMDPEYLTCNDNRGHKTIMDRASVDVSVAHLPRYNRFKSGHPAGFLEAFSNLYWDIAENLDSYQKTGVQTTSQYVFNTNHALEGLVMFESIAQSSKEHCWVSVNLPGKS
ncbi:Gfo/Idh/MocA family protein [Gimesia fumaroli]|uniref:Glucose--fructose oxidoreductase n=1 Tax=Gimesia fumaroli TaxID=2527976 RepID=A0A518IDQ9_9PLAN|nr:Gfo/Idh/MocA family oxidoreductase [Gimesia fumaroli]QDV51207.1 Glucose--fructose oxidoreductase precursor [Gimesia fumaroli]